MKNNKKMIKFQPGGPLDNTWLFTPGEAQAAGMFSGSNSHNFLTPNFPTRVEDFDPETHGYIDNINSASTTFRYPDISTPEGRKYATKFAMRTASGEVPYENIPSQYRPFVEGLQNGWKTSSAISDFGKKFAPVLAGSAGLAFGLGNLPTLFSAGKHVFNVMANPMSAKTGLGAAAAATADIYGTVQGVREGANVIGKIANGENLTGMDYFNLGTGVLGPMGTINTFRAIKNAGPMLRWTDDAVSAIQANNNASRVRSSGSSAGPAITQHDMVNTIDDSAIDPPPVLGTYAIPESAFVPKENPLDAVRQTIRSGYRDDDYTRLMEAYHGNHAVPGFVGFGPDDLRRGGWNNEAIKNYMLTGVHPSYSLADVDPVTIRQNYDPQLHRWISEEIERDYMPERIWNDGGISVMRTIPRLSFDLNPDKDFLRRLLYNTDIDVSKIGDDPTETAKFKEFMISLDPNNPSHYNDMAHLYWFAQPTSGSVQPKVDFEANRRVADVVAQTFNELKRGSRITETNTSADSERLKLRSVIRNYGTEPGKLTAYLQRDPDGFPMMAFGNGASARRLYLENLFDQPDMLNRVRQFMNDGGVRFRSEISQFLADNPDIADHFKKAYTDLGTSLVNEEVANLQKLMNLGTEGLTPELISRVRYGVANNEASDLFEAFASLLYHGSVTPRIYRPNIFIQKHKLGGNVNPIHSAVTNAKKLYKS